MSDDLDSLVQEFLLESSDNLDKLDQTLLELEDQPERRDLVDAVFRTIHTIKGTCGFLEFSWLERLTHAGEGLLSLCRDGDLVLSEGHMTALLRMVDDVRRTLSHVGEHGCEPDGPMDEELVTLLLDLAQPDRVQERVEAEERNPGMLGQQLLEQGKVNIDDIDAALDARDAGDERRLGEYLVDKGLVEQADIDAIMGKPEEEAPAAESTAQKSPSASNQVLRIQVEQLDELMNLVGELVLVRNQVLQHYAQVDDATGSANSHRLDHITTELQEGIMKVRMQPIGHLWSRFPRVVRDLSKALGKQVKVEMVGKDTELDKSLLEAIADPLTHVIRNSVDHGIEAPEVREAAGKPAEGTLRLRAFHESGQINIEISDDGKGIDIERVRQTAIERGVITAERAASLSDRDVAQLIFEPGFSTAEKITNVSGRGVGMDVVRNNIEKIGGIVDLASTPGAGTTLRIKIPLTLAIVPALVVHAGEDRYAIPQVSLVELVRLEGESAERGIEYVHGSPVHRLRGALLPLVFLAEQLDVEPRAEEGDERTVNVVVLQANGRQFGLVVDAISDTEEIVVKPLDAHLKATEVYAGTTIMGDGQVSLILDVLGLAQRAGVGGEDAGRAGADDGAANQGETETYLLFQVDERRRTAIPLSAVSRLEEVEAERVEYAGEQRVVQYRDRIMPLIDVRGALGLPPSTETDEPLQVVVYESCGRTTGLVVDQITDIVEDTVHVRTGESSRGVHESVVIGGEVTDVLDLDAIVTCYSDQDAPPVESTEDAGPQVSQVCTFRLGPHLFGVDVHCVQEVLRFQEMTGVPLTTSTVQGLINLRGQTVTALDLRERLGLPPREEDREPMNVVLMTDSGIVSVLVDEIGEVLEVEEGAREDVPETVVGEVRDLIDGVYKLDGALLLALDIERSVAQLT